MLKINRYNNFNINIKNTVKNIVRIGTILMDSNCRIRSFHWVVYTIS